MEVGKIDMKVAEAPLMVGVMVGVGVPTSSGRGVIITVAVGTGNGRFLKTPIASFRN
jgi:hypothetical protein